VKNNVFPGPDAPPFPKPSPQRPSIASVVEIRPDALDVKGREASGDVVVVERPVWNVHLVESESKTSIRLLRKFAAKINLWPWISPIEAPF